MHRTRAVPVLPVLGKQFNDQLNEAVLQIGFTTFTRQELIDKLGCGNFSAAARLTKVLKRLKIHTLSQLFHVGPFALASVKQVGMAQLYVAMCLLDYDDRDVLAWWRYRGNGVKFSTYKHRQMKRAKKRAVAV